MHHSAGSAQYFDLPRLLAIGIKQSINIAKAVAAEGNSIFCKVKCAAAARASQYRRTNGGEVFLAIASAEPNTRNVIQYFVNV